MLLRLRSRLYATKGDCGKILRVSDLLIESTVGLAALLLEAKWGQTMPAYSLGMWNIKSANNVQVLYPRYRRDTLTTWLAQLHAGERNSKPV